MSPLINHHQFPISKTQPSIASFFFLRPITSVKATYQAIKETRFPWSYNLRLERLMFDRPPPVLTCARAKLSTLSLVSFGISWNTRLLLKSSLLINYCTAWTSSKRVSSVVDSLKLYLLPVHWAPSEVLFPFHATLLALRTL